MESAHFHQESPLHGSKFDYYLWGISWPFCPMVLGMLIPKPGENFSNTLLNALSLD